MGSDKLDADMYGSPGKDGVRAPGGADVVLSAYALRSIVTPANVSVNAQSTKVSVLPALLHHLEQVLGDPCMSIAPAFAPLHCDMAYTDPHAWLGEVSPATTHTHTHTHTQHEAEHGPVSPAWHGTVAQRTLAYVI